MWGFWGFFPKLTTRHINPVSGVVFETLGVAIVGAVMYVGMGSTLQVSSAGILYAVLTGMVGLLGAYFYLVAMTTGKVSVIVTLTALYPVITIGLACLFLKEPITVKEGIGMVLAVAAIVMLTT
jgi:transporter family protein